MFEKILSNMVINFEHFWRVHFLHTICLLSGGLTMALLNGVTIVGAILGLIFIFAAFYIVVGLIEGWLLP